MLQQVLKINTLLDFYAALLTPRQRDVFKMYYGEDLSLGEIAENLEVSRQAVHDILQRGEKVLHEYEQKLGLVHKFTKNRETIADIKERLNALMTMDNTKSIKRLNEQLEKLLI